MSANAGRVLNGRYRLIRTVGVGSQASVWVAEHLALTTQVAVKLIDPDLAKRPDARERFKREATAAAQLRSPHVVQILDHGIDGDQPFIVMELLDGEDLFQRLEKRHHLSIKETSKILTQVARALTRAHAAGVVHRDLKPENVFLTHNEDDEIVKVLDFGVAKVRDAAKVTMQKTGVGTLIGTPHYMSPEQVKGIGEVDYRTDIWAMGVLGFQCVTGELPFDSEGVGDLLIRITIGDMPVPSKVMMGLLPAFDQWFARACDRDAQRRFASARACAEGLARIAGLAAANAGPTSVPRPGASIPPPQDPSKRPSEVPPAPAKKSDKPPPKPAAAKPPPSAAREEELDDGDWEEAEPAVSMEPPTGPEAVTEEIPAAPRLPLAARSAGPAGSPRAANPSAPFVEPDDDEPPPPPAAPPPRESKAGGAGVPPPREPQMGAAPSRPAAVVDGPINPFLVNDFVAPPASSAPVPQPPPSSSGALPARAASGQRPPAEAARPIPPAPISQQGPSAYSMPAVTHGTVTGVETTDIDDEELAFGKNRRKKLVRYFMIALVLLTAGVTWMVVSSQIRARDPVPEPATGQVSATPTVPPAFDPTPPVTATATSTSSTTATVAPKPTAKPRPTVTPGTGHVPGKGPKKPDDGSVELPTPGEDPGLPPPAP